MNGATTGSIASFTDHSLDSPQMVMQRLYDIERDLAMRQLPFEQAAKGWFTAKREQERERARALLSSTEASVTARKASGDIAAYDLDGAAYEAEYEALKAVIRVLETRASVCQSLLRAQAIT